MAELQMNLGWTLAVIGVCWLALSCAVALAIGQIIRRGKTPMDSAQLAFAPIGQDGVATVAAVEEETFAQPDELPALELGSRAASGTRLKAVVLEELPETRQVG